MKRRRFIQLMTAGTLAATPAMKALAMLRDFGSPVAPHVVESFVGYQEVSATVRGMIPGRCDGHLTRAFITQYQKEVVEYVQQGDSKVRKVVHTERWDA